MSDDKSVSGAARALVLAYRWRRPGAMRWHYGECTEEEVAGLRARGLTVESLGHVPDETVFLSLLERLVGHIRRIKRTALDAMPGYEARDLQHIIRQCIDLESLVMYGGPFDPSAEPGFYIVNFQEARYRRGGPVVFWKADNRGYTTDLQQAGIYREVSEGYHDRNENMPVPVSVVHAARIRHYIDPGDSGNRMFWGGVQMQDHLRDLRFKQENAGMLIQYDPGKEGKR